MSVTSLLHQSLKITLRTWFSALVYFTTGNIIFGFNMTVRSKFIYRNWSLFFEKPNFVNDESAALGIHHTADQHLHHRGNHRFLGFDTELELQIYETRIPYSAVVGDLVKFRNSNPQYTNHDDYLRMAKLDKRLNTWYTSLPDHLKWAPDNILRAPMSLLLLQ